MNHETAVSNAKDIADRILAPAARQNDKEARFSSEAIAALGPAGLLGIMLPTDLGVRVSDQGHSAPSSPRSRKPTRRPRWFT